MGEKVALITGAARGIGKAIAEKFAKNGYNLVINYVSDNTDLDAIKEDFKKYDVEVLLEKAAQFVKGINTIIKTSSYMSNLIKKGEIKLLLNYDISQSPGFFLDITAKFLHDYWIKETKANECSVEIGVNKNGENWISIKIKK